MASSPAKARAHSKFIEWSFGTLATLCLGFGFSSLVDRQAAMLLICAAVILYAVVFRFHESNGLPRQTKNLITIVIVSMAVMIASAIQIERVIGQRHEPPPPASPLSAAGVETANSPIDIKAPVTQSAGSCGANVIGNGNTVTNCPPTSEERKKK